MSATGPDLHGRVCLVTGATSGIGRVTAEELAGMGATTLLVARDAERGERARRQIAATTGNQRLHVLLADLAAQAQVRRLAEQVRDRADRLHVLVNNAGLVLYRRAAAVPGPHAAGATVHEGSGPRSRHGRLARLVPGGGGSERPLLHQAPRDPLVQAVLRPGRGAPPLGGQRAAHRAVGPGEGRATMRFGVIGTGMVGQAIGGNLDRLDHGVLMRALHSGKPKDAFWVAATGPAPGQRDRAGAAGLGDIV